MAELPLELSVADVKSLQDQQADFFFMDCREKGEYDTASIAGAQLFPMSELQERGAELEPQKSRRVIVHCHHGGRSLRVARWLRAQGYSQAQSMAGGIDSWSLDIDPTVPRY